MERYKSARRDADVAAMVASEPMASMHDVQLAAAYQRMAEAFAKELEAHGVAVPTRFQN